MWLCGLFSIFHKINILFSTRDKLQGSLFSGLKLLKKKSRQWEAAKAKLFATSEPKIFVLVRLLLYSWWSMMAVSPISLDFFPIFPACVSSRRCYPVSNAPSSSQNIWEWLPVPVSFIKWENSERIFKFTTFLHRTFSGVSNEYPFSTFAVKDQMTPNLWPRHKLEV